MSDIQRLADGLKALWVSRQWERGGWFILPRPSGTGRYAVHVHHSDGKATVSGNETTPPTSYFSWRHGKHAQKLWRRDVWGV